MNKHIKQTNRYLWSRRGKQTLLCGAALLVAPLSIAQSDEEEEIFELSPFTVEGSEDTGYRATSTLAGTRIRTDLKDVGSAISVVTEEFLRDTGAVDNETLLVYTTNTEVGGPQGNFAGVGNGATPTENFTTPNQNTRVRGLAAADNTRNYFLSDIPWDGFNVNRVDMQRGPNAILFGLGSPAGIINVTTESAAFEDEGEVQLRFGSHGSMRLSVNMNQVIIEDELSVRFAAMRDDQKFQQDPAYEDDKRLYGTMTYNPRFLQGDSFNSSLSASFESGKIDSNRPRSLPPLDRITPWFRPVGSTTTYQVGDSTVTRGYGEAAPDGGYPINVEFPLYGGVGRQLFDPYDIEDQSQVGVGFGSNRDTVDWPNDPSDPDAGTTSRPNPYFVPMLGNYSQVFASPLMVFPDIASSETSGMMVHEIKQHYGIGPDGSIDRGFSTPYGRIGSVDLYSEYVRQANIPLNSTGTFKNIYLKDPSVFDFYNTLIDGPNKNEWTDFDDISLSFSQNYFDNSLGYELSYYEESVNRGNVSILSNGGNQALFIDTNASLGDGSPNPNAGRPFVSDALQFGNNETQIDRDSFRATVYAEHDFNEGRDNWLTRIIGRHRATGLYVEDNREIDSRDFARYRILSDEFADLQLVGGYNGNELSEDGNSYFSNEFTINTTHYLGGSLLDRTSASGSNIPGISARHEPSGNGVVRLFDHTWASPAGVSPSDWWDANGNGVEDLDAGGTRVLGENQSENPDNYVGWRDVPYELVTWDQTADARERYDMYKQASRSRSEIESEALVWQGFFWDGAIVGNYGWRKDTSTNWTTAAPQDGTTQVADVDPSVYNLNFTPVVEVGQSQSWSVAAHLNELIGEKLPFNVSLYYNESENFQPGAGRVDIYGNPLPSPSGSTTDKSILIATKDNRYSLKVTDYETSVAYTNSSYIDGTWFVGNLVTWGTTWANIAEYDLNGSTLDTKAPQNEIDNRGPDEVKRWAYGNDELEANAVAAWRDFTAAIPQKWIDAWGINGDLNNDVINFATNQGPAGLTYTQDAVSTGTEFEFTAQPTDNWRIAINASKTEAIRNNVGGESFKEWVDFIDGWLQDTDAGDIRVWWGSAAPIRDSWNNTFRSNYSLTELLEGTANPEIREWAFNVVTNYDFRDGFLKGASIGGSYRWQDDIVIGYPIGEDENGRPVFDLDNPYLGPTEDAVDLWVGYSRELSDNLNWRIQLNIRNALGENELVPIATQPNGDYSSVRIKNGPSWQITNTFSF